MAEKNNLEFDINRTEIISETEDSFDTKVYKGGEIIRTVTVNSISSLLKRCSDLANSRQ